MGAQNAAVANTATAAAIVVGAMSLVGAADSTQANTASTATIKQTHLLTCAAVAVDNIASASAIVQTHLIAAANAVIANTATSAAVSSGIALFTQAELDFLLAYMQENLMIPSASEIAAAVLAALQATQIPVDVNAIASAVWNKTLP